MMNMSTWCSAPRPAVRRWVRWERRVLRIIDVDPNTTPPQVTGLTWTRHVAVDHQLEGRLQRTARSDLCHESGQLPARRARAGQRGHPLDPATLTTARMTPVTLAPSIALPSGQYLLHPDRRLRPVRDPRHRRQPARRGRQRSGRLRLPGELRAGNQAQLSRRAGNKVSLKLAGSGYMEQVRDASGEGVLLDLVGVKPHHATLSGTVKAAGGRSRAVKKNKPASSTELGTIRGPRQLRRRQSASHVTAVPRQVLPIPAQWSGASCKAALRPASSGIDVPAPNRGYESG